MHRETRPRSPVQRRRRLPSGAVTSPVTWCVDRRAGRRTRSGATRRTHPWQARLHGRRRSRVDGLARRPARSSLVHAPGSARARADLLGRRDRRHDPTRAPTTYDVTAVTPNGEFSGTPAQVPVRRRGELDEQHGDAELERRTPTRAEPVPRATASTAATTAARPRGPAAAWQRRPRRPRTPTPAPRSPP